MSKRRSNGEGSIRQRTDKTWEGRISVQGKRISVYGRTKNEVRQKLTNTQWEVDNNSFVHAPDKLTVNMWLDIWLDNCSGHLTHSSLYERKQYARLYVRPYIGDIKLEKLCPNDIRTLYNKLVKRGLADNTIRNTKNVIRSALQQAVDDEILKKNVAAKIMPPHSQKETKEIKPLSDEEIARFLSEIEDNYWGPLFFVDLFTGLRKGELIGLTWDCVDFEKETIHIYRQLHLMEGEGYYAFTKLKNKKDRTIFPPKCVFDMLKFVKRRQAEQKLRYGDAWENKEDFVFTHDNGLHCTHRGVFQTFKRIVRRIGLPEARLHDLRHTYATISLQNGVDPKTISLMLGHSTVRFTLDVYTHFTDTSAKKAAALMDTYANNIKLG